MIAFLDAYMANPVLASLLFLYGLAASIGLVVMLAVHRGTK